MPPSKRQKTGDSSSVARGPPAAGENRADYHLRTPDRLLIRNWPDRDRESESEPGPYDYICIHRPFFDVDGEHVFSAHYGGKERKSRFDVEKQTYEPGWLDDDAKDIFGAKPELWPEHKWLMMWDAWAKFDDLCRKAKYWDPNNFDMHILIDFDGAYQKKDIKKAWVEVSALGLWLNVGEHSLALMGRDADRTFKLVELVGLALLAILNTPQDAGELNDSSTFLELPLVAGYYLEVSHNLPDYGIEGKCMAWRREVVKIFEDAKLKVSKSLYTMVRRLTSLEVAPNHNPSDHPDEAEMKAAYEKTVKGPDGDPWNWNATLAKYKHDNRPLVKPNKHRYDNTKMTRA
ncbi:hypothetical protein E8E11_004420 [Didymella keratinophila]|nr:hypothetical protein E8E11_004420 [Didymella keratinophila]